MGKFGSYTVCENDGLRSPAKTLKNIQKLTGLHSLSQQISY